MAKLENAHKLVTKLKAMSPKGRAVREVGVGYSAPHALPVHEDLEAHHDVGRAKYLEAPWRYLRPRMRRMIADDTRRKKGLGFALLRAGQWFIETTRPLVPVDTGELRDSAYARLK